MREEERDQPDLGASKAIDWHAEAATTLAEPWTSPWTGATYASGTLVTKATMGPWERTKRLAFVTPSPEALALHVAFEAAERCTRLRSGFAVRPPGHAGDDTWQIANGELPALYDYLESCWVVITFAFQALETFANREIEAGVQLTHPVTRRGETVQLTAAEIQRLVSTDEKLATIVPGLVGVRSPKGRAVWSGYRQLKSERDAVVHLKAEDAYPRRDWTQESAFHRLVRADIARHPDNTVALIGWFYTSRPAPRWLGELRANLPR